MKHSAATIERVKHEIIVHYKAVRKAPSGTLAFGSLTFSKVPSKWGLIFITWNDYPDHNPGKYNRTHMEISACLSPDWPNEPTRHCISNGIITGTRPLDHAPFPYLDSLELQYASILNNNRLALKNITYIVLTAGPVRYCHVCEPSPAILAKETRISYGVIKKMIARKVSQRLTHSKA